MAEKKSTAKSRKSTDSKSEKKSGESKNCSSKSEKD